MLSKGNKKYSAILGCFLILSFVLAGLGVVNNPVYAQDNNTDTSGEETQEAPKNGPEVNLNPGGGAGELGVASESSDGNQASVNSLNGRLSFYKKIDVHGGYVTAGTGMRNLGKGKITITSIPAGSTIKAAYLYWNIISYNSTTENKKGYIDGHVIYGGLIGTTDSPCWSNGYSRSYRADVTSYVVPDSHTYLLTGFASGIRDGSDPWYNLTEPINEGATLVVIYNQSRYPLTSVILYNGAVETQNTNYAETIMYSVPSYDSYLAYTTFIVADGQSNGTKMATVNGTTITKADLNGTDPKWTGGSYLHGNLWDTELNSTINTAARSISIGQYIKPGNTSVKVQVIGDSDCLVYVAQVLSVSNGELDTDEDGLKDSWEANGYKSVNLPSLSANPFHKDVFLEIDYMGSIHKPNSTVVSSLVNAFHSGDVVNPDRKTGIALHVDVSNSITHQDEFTTTPGCTDLWTKLEDTKKANMVADRYPIYHYQLWVHNLCPDLGSTSGISESIPGDDSIVSLGSWSWPFEGTTNERIGTSMHELGHTLNLRHGYPTGMEATYDGPNDAYSPNHLSIMSYLYQTFGLIKNGKYGLFDYQRWDLSPLDETCLDESKGVGSVSALDSFGLKWMFSNGSIHQNLTAGSANGPVDWNANGKIDSCANISINKNSTKETLPATKEEWQLIVYDGGDVGFAAEAGMNIFGEKIPVYYVNPLTDHELTYDEAVALSNQ